MAAGSTVAGGSQGFVGRHPAPYHAAELGLGVDPDDVPERDVGAGEHVAVAANDALQDVHLARQADARLGLVGGRGLFDGLAESVELPRGVERRHTPVVQQPGILREQRLPSQRRGHRHLRAAARVSMSE
jgi:hypothetical protein